MARRAKTQREDVTGSPEATSRLALIKRRHRELILKPREVIAADFGDELDDPFEEILDADQMEVSEPVDAVQL
jgi:hypothetical protein